MRKIIITLFSGDAAARYFAKYYGEKKPKYSEHDEREANEFAVKHTFNDTSSSEEDGPLFNYCRYVAKEVVSSGNMPWIIWDVAQVIKNKKSVSERRLRKALDDAYLYCIKENYKDFKKKN